jgi:hypothetical protein
MTEELIIEQLKEVLDRRPGPLLKKRGIWDFDPFKGHLTDKVQTLIF